MPQAHFRVSVPLKTLPPSLLLLQAACSALTPSLPLTRVAWRKPRVQHANVAATICLAAAKKQQSLVLFQAVKEQEGALALGLQR